MWLRADVKCSIPDSGYSPDSGIGPTHIDVLTKLRDIWATILQDDISSFSNEDVFFEVGGDSITAQRLVEAAAKEGIHLTMEQIFMNASLEDMAGTARLVEPPKGHASVPDGDEILDRNREQDQVTLDEVAKYCGLPASSIESAYGLTPMQESLLVEHDGFSNSYVRQFVFRVRPGLELAHLRRAWDETIQTNPVLRTRICQLQGLKTLQAVVRADAEPVSWNITQASLENFLEEDARVPMLIGDAFFRYAIIEDAARRAHYFVWTAHHALCDGASIPEILSDVGQRFRGEPGPQRPSFASFIRSPAISPDPALEQQFWTQALSGVHPTPWPAAPHGLEFRANPSTGVLEHHLTLDSLPPFGTTKSLLLRAAWAILLSHYTGTDEVIFGAINNGRTAAVPGVSRMTGPTINLVPIVSSVGPEQSVSGLLQRIRHQTVEMMPFEHSGPSRIRRFLAMDKSQQTTALDLRSLLVVHPTSFAAAVEPSMKTLGLEYVGEVGKKEQHPYPLVLTFALSADGSRDPGILLRIEYDELIIPSPQALRLAHLFERQVRKRPGAIAVCSIGGSLTYEEVDVHASSLAAQLIELGVRPGVFVGVCFDKSIWTVVAIMAVFKAGGIYVPMDPAHPRGRIEEIVRMVGMKVSLASPNGGGVLRDIFEPKELSIIQVQGGPAHRPWAEPPRVASRPSDTAYLLFTSGSTGKPKGILMPHRAICTSILHHGPAFNAGPHWRTLQFCAHTFDLSIAEFFTTLSFGGCVCVPSEQDRTDDLAGAITALRANTLIVVPTVANLLLPAEVRTLERLILSGEPIPKEAIVRWADRVNLTCAYGPSETAVWCSANLRVGRDAHQSHEALGGGYYGDNATTDAAFVEAPGWMRQLTGDTMLYRSGDLGRSNPDGTFHVVGRRDTQVKLRGLRIELGEIENRLTQGGLVTAALDKMPLLISGKMDRKRLKQWLQNMTLEMYNELVGSGENENDQGQVEAVVPGSLADKLRQVWSNVLRMPAAQIGMATSFFAAGGDSIAAIQIVSQAKRALPDVPVSVRAIINAKTLGNLAAMMGEKELEEREGGKGEEHPSASSQASSGQSTDSGKILLGPYRPLLTSRLAQAQAGNQVQVEGAHLLSAFQREILRARSANPAVFLMSWRMELWSLTAEPLSLPRLKAAWQGVVARFPVLRSIFLKDAPERLGLPVVQVVLDAQAASEATVVVCESPSSAPEPEFGDARAPDVDACFLPHRAHILRHGERVYLHVEMDHLIIDGWSLGLIKRALLEAYEAGPDKDSHNSSTVASYKAFVAAHGSPDRIKIDDAYWERLLHGLSPSALSSALHGAGTPSRQLQHQQHSRQGKVILSLPSIPAASLTPFSATHGLTPASIFSAAWAKTLSSFTGKSDVAFECVVSGRDEDDYDHNHQPDAASVWDLVGCCINVLVHRVEGVVGADMAGLAARLQEQSAEGAHHGASNVREVAARLSPVRLFDTAVNFQRRPTAVENEARTLRVDDDLTRSVDPWHFDILVRVLHITDDNTLRPSLEFFEQDYNPDTMEYVGQDWWRRVKELAT
ncbi:hypothetical protein KVR01_011997 [Diaporthe batatas]|uniref:uncharacterized protein n=1 Tax=Diaporthe batatas TaxID=748121 RepID=UPI001D057150|nr:uncharacterized protein KVR01_011997 [Diaporthe batatas]KAG8158236.1 hypothetical protein KVR01_011997 [Diaporthe batatas]